MATKNKYEEIERFQDDLEQCMKCGFCTYWCPVYQEEKLESSVARGKNMMIRGLLDGELEYTKEFAERLNKCTLCMTCTEKCPAKTKIPPVIVAARADTVKARGLKFPYNIIYKYILSHRKLFGGIVRIASWFQGIFMPNVLFCSPCLSGKTFYFFKKVRVFIAYFFDGMEVFQFAFPCLIFTLKGLLGNQSVKEFVRADGFTLGQKLSVSAEQGQKGIDLCFRRLFKLNLVI